MAFVHGKGIFVLLNGYNITGYLNKIETPLNADTAETSTFGLGNKTYIVGQKGATMSAEGLFDGALGAIDELLESIIEGGNANNVLNWFPAGNVLGNIGYGMKMIKTAYDASATKDEAVRINMAGQSMTGRDRAILMHALASKTTDGSAASIDNGASSSSGGVAYLHVPVAGGGIDVVVEHSSDNFAADNDELVAFTTAETDNAYERVTFTGTVKRYVRVTWVLLGAPTTFAVAVARN